MTIPVLVAAGVAVVSVALRLWQANGRVPGWWNDTGAYADIAERSLSSGRFWMGHRPAGVPLVLKAAGDEPSYAFMYVNIAVAGLAWGWLCGELVRTLRVTGIRAVAVAGVVLGFSCVSDLMLWDSQVLSESLSISLAAAIVAATLRLLRVRSTGSVVDLLVLAFAWSLLRDSHAITLLVLAVAGIVWMRRFAPSDVPRRLAVAGIAGLVLVAGLSMTSALVGHRDLVPLADVFAARILGYPDRVDWFDDHGMPQADEIREAGSNIGPDAGTRILELGRNDPKWAEWWDWLESDGKATWVRFALENPTYIFLEPMKDPERVFNNAGDDLKGYAGSLREVPFVDDVFWPETTLVLFALGAFSVPLIGRRPPRLVAVGWVLIAAAAVSGLATWHSGGQEPLRHLLISAFELRLGVLLVAIGVLVDRLREPGPPAPDDDAVDERAYSGA